MLFTTYEFIGFVFLLFLLYYTLPKRFQWMLLLIGSYAFYASAGPFYPVYLIATTATTYLSALRMERIRKTGTRYLIEIKDSLSREDKKKYQSSLQRKQFAWLLGCLLLNLGVLFVLKYDHFMITNMNSLLQSLHIERRLDFLNLALPLGISFYMFQSIGYLIDVYRETQEPERNPFRYALFVSFFPQLIQGPISRFEDLAETLYQAHPLQYKQVSFGLQRILWGYFKKLVVADRLLIAVNTLFDNPDLYQGSYVFVGMILYGIELYADFTGGIDITIGVAEVFGVRIRENFLRPYFSKSITEYWRRWHISMGTWFRDYVFYPISISPAMNKMTKWTKKRFGNTAGKKVPVYLATFVTWTATGMWHGASWNFIIWGWMNCLFILISQELVPLCTKFHERFPRLSGSVCYRIFQIVRTFLLLCCLRMFDCYAGVGTTFYMFASMLTEFQLSVFTNGSLLNLGLGSMDYAIVLAGVLVMFTVSFIQRKGGVRERLSQKPILLRYALYYSLILSILLMGMYGFEYDAHQFIYNRF